MIALGLRVGPAGLLVGGLVDPAVTEAWRKVVFFASKAKDANELNGAIVNAHPSSSRRKPSRCCARAARAPTKCMAAMAVRRTPRPA